MTKSQIEICRAKEEDMFCIEKKLQKYLLDATNTAWQQFFVLKNGGRIVAFSRIIDHGEYFETASLGVDYYHRGKGFGSKMIISLIEEAKKMDPQKPIYGVTHLPEFFRKAGFVEVNNYPEYLDYKKNHICKYPSKVKIVKYEAGKATIA